MQNNLNNTSLLQDKWLIFRSPLVQSKGNLSLQIIISLVNLFFSGEFNKFKANTILIQVRLDLGKGSTKSLTPFSKINITDLRVYCDSITEWYNLHNSHYNSTPFHSIYLSYKLLEQEVTYIHLYEEPKTSSALGLLTPPLSSNKISFANSTLHNLMLPLSLDLWNWSEDIVFNQSYTFATFTRHSLVYTFDISKNCYKCTITSKNSGSILFSFTDFQLSSTSDLTSFERVYKDTTLLYINGELTSTVTKLDNVYIKKLNKSANFSNKFITLDLETQGSNIIPGTVEQSLVSISIYNGHRGHSWYITDYPSAEAMADSCLSYLLNKFSGYNIYVHNLSGFDVVYLINSISKFGDNVDVIMKDSKFISITIRHGNKRITLRDSLLILPSSLDKLGKSFGVGEKVEFDFSTFNNANLSDPCVRDSILRYNLSDCVLLYDVINSFSKLMWNLFKVDIHQYPTLTSIAFSLYRTKFMDKPNIPVTSLSFYDNIKSGYMGGHVDVYRPRIEQGYYYDVNALYPTVMRNNPYPVGRGIYFKGNRPLSSVFGIVYASIVAPQDMYAPILLTKTDRLETIAPLGNWKGWYFSGELMNAERFGYQVEVLEGYHWTERDYIFSKFVDTLYNLRQTFDRHDPQNLICKLLLNSLYGRFGLSPRLEEYSFKEIQSKVSDNLLIDRTEIGDKELFGYQMYKNRNLTWKGDRLDISLPISFITAAYARIFMSEVKVKYSDYLFYSDTDSAVTSKPLPKHIVGNALGQFKLEYKFQRGVFLAPKVYGLVLEDGTEIIKVKGSTVLPTFAQLEQILDSKEPLALNQSRWTKNFSAGHVSISDIIYNLMLTDNKRKFIYDMNGVIVDTTPLFFYK